MFQLYGLFFVENWRAFPPRYAIDYTRPGHPTDNGMIESLNGSLRDECLNLHWFGSVEEAQAVLEAWKMDYNTEMSRSSFGYVAPSAYMAQRAAVWL